MKYCVWCEGYQGFKRATKEELRFDICPNYGVFIFAASLTKYLDFTFSFTISALYCLPLPIFLTILKERTLS